MSAPRILPPRPFEIQAGDDPVVWPVQRLTALLAVIAGCLMCVLALVVGLLPLARNLELYADGSPGRIIYARQAAAPGASFLKTYFLEVDYEDLAGGRHSGKTKLTRFVFELDPSRTVDLRYDPLDPTRFVLSDSTDVISELAFPTLAFGFFAVATFAAFRALRQPKRHRNAASLCATESEELLVELLELVRRTDGPEGYIATYRPAEGPTTARRDVELDAVPLIVRDGGKRRLVLLRSSLEGGAEMVVRADLWPFIIPERERQRIAEISLPATSS